MLGELPPKRNGGKGGQGGEQKVFREKFEYNNFQKIG